MRLDVVSITSECQINFLGKLWASSVFLIPPGVCLWSPVLATKHLRGGRAAAAVSSMLPYCCPSSMSAKSTLKVMKQKGAGSWRGPASSASARWNKKPKRSYLTARKHKHLEIVRSDKLHVFVLKIRSSEGSLSQQEYHTDDNKDFVQNGSTSYKWSSQWDFFCWSIAALAITAAAVKRRCETKNLLPVAKSVSWWIVYCSGGCLSEQQNQVKTNTNKKKTKHQQGTKQTKETK